MAITLSILNRFVKNFHYCKERKFPTKPILVYRHTLSVLLHYLRKLKTICTDTFLETLSTLQLTNGESISRHVSVQMVDILNTFYEQTHTNNLHFRMFLVQVASAHGVRFFIYCVDA